jgi:hypothetical protein
MITIIIDDIIVETCKLTRVRHSTSTAGTAAVFPLAEKLPFWSSLAGFPASSSQFYSDRRPEN